MTKGKGDFSGAQGERSSVGAKLESMWVKGLSPNVVHKILGIVRAHVFSSLEGEYQQSPGMSHKGSP